MTDQFETEQEKFWAGDFGDIYSNRNLGDRWVASNTALFAKVLSRTTKVGSLIEFGSNIGLNLRALRNLLPTAEMTAIEINKNAAEQLAQWGGAEVLNQSILDFQPSKQWDLALIKGVLIHINPDSLPRVYDALFESSSRYICIVEYYNPTPVTVSYRGHADRLFKRDFAGELMDRYRTLRLVDYGFTYSRDPNFPQDDTTWFLLEKEM